MHKSLFAAGAATGEDAPTALSYAVFRTLELSVVFWPIALFAFRRLSGLVGRKGMHHETEDSLREHVPDAGG